MPKLKLEDATFFFNFLYLPIYFWIDFLNIFY